MSRTSEDSVFEAAGLLDFREPPSFYRALNGDDQGHLAALAVARSFGSVLGMVPRGSIKLTSEQDILDPIRDALFALYHPFQLDIAPSFSTLDEYDYEQVFEATPTADIARVIATSACMHAAEARNTKNVMNGWTAIVLSALSFSVSTLAHGKDSYETTAECFEDLLNDFIERALMDNEYLAKGEYQTLLNNALWDELPQRDWQRKFTLSAFDRVKHRGEVKNNWSFWAEWFENWLLDKPASIELMVDIYNISDPIWQKGPEAVAAEIERIQAEHLNEAAAYHEVFTLDEPTQTFSIHQHSITNQGVLKVALGRAEDALEDVLDLGNGNGLTTNTVEARILQRLFKKYADDPRRVVFDFSEVLRSIKDNIKKGEFPEDDPLKVLISALGIGRDEICEVEPDLRAELDRSFEKAPETPPTEDEALLLTEAMRIFPQIFDQRAADDLGEDVAEVLHGEMLEADEITPDLPLTDKTVRLSVRRRLAARISKLYSEIRIRPKLREHYDSDRFKENRVVGTYGGILSLLAAVGGVLARLLGAF